MPTDRRKKVSILFLNKPDLEELGLKYLILSLNKIQACFEFEFPDINGYPMEEENYSEVNAPILEFAKTVKEKNLDGDYFIGILKGQIGNNWFWAASGKFGILTTIDWKKYFSPPSVLEYVTHCITSLLIVMSDKRGSVKSHYPTRGCCLDFTALKEEDRVDIALGYVCDNCKSRIKEEIGEGYLECFEKIHSMEWLGDVEQKGTVANDLKKYFKIDLNKDTGYYKTRREKIKEFFVGMSKELTSVALSTLIGLLIGFIVGHWVGKS